DKLLFRILNSGDFLSGVNNLAADTEAAVLMPFVSEKGLRYDLTVPFARYVVQYRNDIVFPFKRYQIQPVWRADRPQKGRYREFYQCDAEIVGSDALLNEAELVQMVNDVFKKLSIKVVVKINNRKILAGIANYIGKPEAITDITVAIDKLDKIGIEQVNNELLAKGIDQNAVGKLQPILFMQGSSREKLQQMAELIGDNETGAKGINEMQTLFDYLEAMHLDLNFELDLTLARGLNYYTGAILEVKATEVQMGSICGGGRYDDLTGIFGMPGVSGVGISFGADRIYDVMKELSLFPEKSESSTAVLFVNFGSAEEKYCLPLLSDLRKAGINSEIYPEADKMKKQMKYADQKKINFVVLAGETEIKSGLLTVKNMLNGEQSDVKTEQLAAYFLEKLH
ncbi:MAG: histidine--tRNA ligase, partial [Bacteroidales bacterium]|nr:histidine--tRNA ligase [Bacteroidales bacterium]